ncbi:recombinase family protein [Lichenihabitans sp. Uapishka_5]|uniref:recombinase family protein n=1 Tax=Lichenihabitans sp. Uapishka_5 TaxID=3037302 RepID=UPI0029E80A48|nr:recombinase family protein [Lichenihabitans sp. Uapishka_5]MDX7951265.1 recombinase family protein [Lichenihabitans sp. Uapishka_5]
MASKQNGHAAPARRLRAIGYCRVSTGRQAAHELSLDEQDRKIRAGAELKDGDIIEMFVEQGASGRTDKRPVFQRMIAFALDRANAVDVVIVYNFSRYFRNVASYLQYRTLLKNAGVRLISATQDVPEGATGELIETIFAAFDGHASDVNAATVRDMMIANAEAGYWNGARQPYGYETRTVVVLRKKEKKKLFIVEEEAAVVRLVYKLCLEGHATSGPLGIKAICTFLNTRGFKMRGKPYYTAAIENILKSETYKGTAYFNCRDSRTKLPRPPEEWVKVPVPPIVTPEMFATVQRRLESRRPTRTAPRAVNGPTLLTGLAKCDCCTSPDGERAGMMLRTGKSGQYRYLVCANRATKSVYACTAPQLRMEEIDELVLGEVERRVLAPARMKTVLAKLLERRDSDRQATETELQRQRDALKKAENGLRNMLAAIANAPDLIRIDDPLTREQISLLNRQRAELSATIPALQDRLRTGPVPISDERIATFSAQVRQRLRHADPSFRRQWLRLFVDEVVVGRREITISGQNDALLKGVTGKPDFFGPVVPSLDREWRTRHDSNV